MFIGVLGVSSARKAVSIPDNDRREVFGVRSS